MQEGDGITVTKPDSFVPIELELKNRELTWYYDGKPARTTRVDSNRIRHSIRCVVDSHETTIELKDIFIDS